MFINNLLNQGSSFENLTIDDIQNANWYFEDNPKINKYSRKQSKSLYSFIKTTEGLFVISRITIGTGLSGYVKIAKHINTKTIVAVKIQLSSMLHIDDYENLHQETEILHKLGQLHSTSFRWKHDLTGPGLMNSHIYWCNKYTKHKHQQIKYNLKYYIFTRLFDGVTLLKYFENYSINTEKVLRIIIKVFEQLDALHNKNIVHGDLNFSNIVILETFDGNIEVNLIDFGLSVMLKNGIGKYKVFDYEFNNQLNCIAPESDCNMVMHNILPELKSSIGRSISEAEYYNIYTWARRGYGFNTVASDVYGFSWHINRMYYLYQDTNLDNPLQYYNQYNPFARRSIDFFISLYKQRLADTMLIQKLIKVILDDQNEQAKNIDPIKDDDIVDASKLNPILHYDFSSKLKSNTSNVITRLPNESSVSKKHNNKKKLTIT